MAGQGVGPGGPTCMKQRTTVGGGDAAVLAGTGQCWALQSQISFEAMRDPVGHSGDPTELDE
ncbi:hypothetical protein PG990_009652 [Apiospora arundinis]|uniref:Uncharacterized protein n=1 Tax=Apiospora arundinis TaxID=335852 RepID=A0ABR2ITC2_9PEZI